MRVMLLQRCNNLHGADFHRLDWFTCIETRIFPHFDSDQAKLVLARVKPGSNAVRRPEAFFRLGFRWPFNRLQLPSSLRLHTDPAKKLGYLGVDTTKITKVKANYPSA
jgi:hypothetical protein